MNRYEMKPQIASSGAQRLLKTKVGNAYNSALGRDLSHLVIQRTAYNRSNVMHAHNINS